MDDLTPALPDEITDMEKSCSFLSPSSLRDVGVQVRESPLLCYQYVQERRRRIIRMEVITELKSLVSHFCHGDEKVMHDLTLDILSSSKFSF